MDRVNALGFRQRHNPRDVEVRLDRPFACSNQIRFVRLETVQRQPILLRIHRHRAQAQFVRGTENSYRDFAAIRSQQFPDWFVRGHPSARAGVRSRALFHAGRVALQ